MTAGEIVRILQSFGFEYDPGRRKDREGCVWAGRKIDRSLTCLTRGNPVFTAYITRTLDDAGEVAIVLFGVFAAEGGVGTFEVPIPGADIADSLSRALASLTMAYRAAQTQWNEYGMRGSP